LKYLSALTLGIIIEENLLKIEDRYLKDTLEPESLLTGAHFLLSMHLYFKKIYINKEITGGFASSYLKLYTLIRYSKNSKKDFILKKALCISPTLRNYLQLSLLSPIFSLGKKNFV
jgi:hypothetical protein